MTTTPLINPACRQQKRHMIEWYGLGLCCLHDYRRDRVRTDQAWRRGER